MLLGLPKSGIFELENTRNVRIQVLLEKQPQARSTVYANLNILME